MIITIIACIITGAIVALITWLIVSKCVERNNNLKISNANERAKQIIENATVSADNLKKEAQISAKEEMLRLKNDLDKEIKEQRNEVLQYEKRIISKEQMLDKKTEDINSREKGLTAKEEQIEEIKRKTESVFTKQIEELEKISGLSSEEAKTYILNIVNNEVLDEKARIIKTAQNEAREDADKKVREIIINAISRCDVDHVSEAAVSAVELPNDEMKGRIIGREGRNIRTFETVTGVELIVDDTPEAVVLSCFNPIRRQIAKMTLEKLMADGRIHPARIEEMALKSRKELDETIKTTGENTVMDLGLHGIHPEIVRLLGRMNYRTSYGQNVLKHSIEVALLSGMIATEIGADEMIARRAGLLHDIGKSVDFEMKGSHVEIGAEICRKYKESPIVINAVESHHGDTDADNEISFIVKCADMISATRPGARREDIEVYINRLKQLEEICNSYEGVEKSFAIQAGREVRIMVTPEKISDAQTVVLARSISKQIENEMQYPGQIKVSVIRESRATEYAK